MPSALSQSSHRKRPPDPRGAWRRKRTRWGTDIGIDAAIDAVDPKDAPPPVAAQIGLFSQRPVPSQEFIDFLHQAYQAANIGSYRQRVKDILDDAERDAAEAGGAL
ncbi:MAG: hypothetical protein GXP39_08060 [Chloroflexi bacterium]|nr:hypothetical protein [Chloroflexota bacterium]